MKGRRDDGLRDNGTTDHGLRDNGSRDHGQRTTDNGTTDNGRRDNGPRECRRWGKFMRDYKKIEAWKLADDLAVRVYEITRGFPKEELYGLTSQLRRAAVSVPANIAEGSARGSKKDYLHFLYIARASLTEVQYLLHLAGRLGYAVNGEGSDSQVRRTFACLHGLIRSVEGEASKVSRIVAGLTSALCLCAAQWSGRGVSLS